MLGHKCGHCIEWKSDVAYAGQSTIGPVRANHAVAQSAIVLPICMLRNFLHFAHRKPWTFVGRATFCLSSHRDLSCPSTAPRILINSSSSYFTRLHNKQSPHRTLHTSPSMSVSKSRIISSEPLVLLPSYTFSHTANHPRTLATQNGQNQPCASPLHSSPSPSNPPKHNLRRPDRTRAQMGSRRPHDAPRDRGRRRRRHRCAPARPAHPDRAAARARPAPVPAADGESRHRVPGRAGRSERGRGGDGGARAARGDWVPWHGRLRGAGRGAADVE